MIEFDFNVGKAFLRYMRRPITIPKEFHERLRETSIVKDKNVKIVCPDGSLMSGYVYLGRSGYGPYYQIEMKGHEKDSLSNIPGGTKIRVKIHEDNNKIELLVVRRLNNDKSVNLSLKKEMGVPLVKEIVNQNEVVQQPSIDLATFVKDFAEAMKAADALQPHFKSYKPGIGPHSELKAVELVVNQMKQRYPDRYPTLRTQVGYPNSHEKCDLALGNGPDWAIEVKMARFRRDNGGPEDTATKKIISPYSEDHSALSDCVKLASAGFPGKTAILIYGFEDPERPLEKIIKAFEVLARTHVNLGQREDAPLENLVHPLFNCGRVFAWEISPK